MKPEWGQFFMTQRGQFRVAFDRWYGFAPRIERRWPSRLVSQLGSPLVRFPGPVGLPHRQRGAGA
jgi:hypothetical protein